MSNYFKAIDAVDNSIVRSRSNDQRSNGFYSPHPSLKDYWERLEALIKLRPWIKAQEHEAGDLMEQVAWLAFKGIRGITTIESFQSAGPQYDLLATGDDELWIGVSKFLWMEKPGSFVVECKARVKEKIDDSEFARMCALLSNSLLSTGAFGVFFTLSGAAGFPVAGASTRQRVLRDCQLRQVRFMDQTHKPIVVFDEEDLRSLANGANLVQMLRIKAREIEQQPGVDHTPITDLKKCDVLPTHLAELARLGN